MIISIDAEKASHKIQHPFVIKTLQKMVIEGIYLNMVKAIYDKPTANIILNGEKLKALPLRSGKTRMSTFTTIIQHNPGSPSYGNQRIKRNKRNPDQKKSKALTDCSDMILHIKYPKEYIRKLLELISEFSKVVGYKINTQKSLAFLYTNNEKSER